MKEQNTIRFILIIFISLFFFSISPAQEIYLSLKKNKVNVRYGPGFDSPIKFIYKKVNLPLKQIDKKENWRRVIDFKNNNGWIHWSQLKPINSLIPIEDKILFKKPSNFSKPLAKIKKGRVLILKECLNNWCKIKTEEFTGWIKTGSIWGLSN